jgi:RNA polymerase sigma factor (sigma-70 family)
MVEGGLAKVAFVEVVSVPFERDDDVVLCRQLQQCAAYILKCFDEYLRKTTKKGLTRRRLGHQNIVLEQIWRGRAPKTVEHLWHKVLGREEDLTLENVVKFLSPRFPGVRSKFKEFQRLSAALMERHKGLAVSIANKIAEEIYHVSVEDVIGEALLGVVSAALRFNPTRRTTFATYAFYVIRSLLLDYVSRAQHGLSYPPSAYVRMKKNGDRFLILSFSDLEDEDEDGDVSSTGEEVVLADEANGLSERQWRDGFERIEIEDFLSKLPPPFGEIALAAWCGEIRRYRDLRAYGIPSVLAAKLWEVLEKLIQKHYL